MNVNWNVRVKNKVFWLTFIPAVLLAVQLVLDIFGVTWDFSPLEDKLIAVVNTVFAILAALGIVADPTTEGVGDSALAMTYAAPKSDKTETAIVADIASPAINIESAIAAISALALGSVGYIGHKTADKLDDPTANQGGMYNIFTKNLDDIGFFYGKKNGHDWCCTGLLDMYVEILGAAATKKLFGMPAKNNYAAAVEYLVQYALAAGGTKVSVPKAGDIAVTGNFGHVTYVVDYDGKDVTTVSFNSEQHANGGMVALCKHGVNAPGIDCYIRPAWDNIKE